MTDAKTDALRRRLSTCGSGALVGREYFAHRNEVILRSGEIPTGVHLLLEGCLQETDGRKERQNQSEPTSASQ